MFAAGLVAEVRRLLAGPHGLSRTAGQAVGYREVIEHLEGRRTLSETIELVKMHTRQLAKRQGTWFRSLSECRPAPLSEPFDPVAIAAQLAAIGWQTQKTGLTRRRGDAGGNRKETRKKIERNEAKKSSPIPLSPFLSLCLLLSAPSSPRLRVSA